MRRLAGLTSQQRLLLGAGAAGAVIVLIAIVLLLATSTSDAYEQPIAFSHNRHVVQNGMECRYCHYGVDEGPVAVIPSVELCMGCHEHIATDNNQIQKLTRYWEDGEPVPWQRVNEQPEFVYFAHHTHIAAGVSCGSCHGNVAQMSEVEPVVEMNMGFCLDCHREQDNWKALYECSVCHR